MSRPVRNPEAEAAGGIAALEGYLLAQSRLQEAQREAEAFADRMPWLTTGQREEVVRLYAEDRVALSRRVLVALVARAAELRQEYTNRYDELRQRLLRRGVAALLGLAALCLFAVACGVPF
ncbi:hypothetical protein ACF08N_00260 [Streptomyces sp. NPDC015127]|uniref:hypothetical protein n=1 Tax=Streptomyces sp. NPDC015127 TaxID=3364939 RepID=UPI0036F4F895